MSDAVGVAIVGAGPYGLSLAAHLGAAGVRFRQFGLPMRLWQESMPAGMFLKSQGFASDLSSPDGEHTLEAFCRATGRPYASYGLPVPLDTFVAYGQWFRRELVADLEETLVTEVVPKDGNYEISLANGDRVRAGSVVVATGVEHFATMPAQLAELPSSVCTHSSAHTDLGAFRGKKVIVLGAGQSALESAALLHENGAYVQLVARKPALAWNGAPLPPEYLVLLPASGAVPALAAAHPGLPCPDGAWAGRRLLAARPGERGAVPHPARPCAEVSECRRRWRGA